MQLVSSGNWTRVAVSISDDDNHYTTGTSELPFIAITSTAQPAGDVKYADCISAEGVRPPTHTQRTLDI